MTDEHLTSLYSISILASISSYKNLAKFHPGLTIQIKAALQEDSDFGIPRNVAKEQATADGSVAEEHRRRLAPHSGTAIAILTLMVESMKEKFK